MRELSLFSGAGGGLLGTHLLGWTPVGYVEFNDYCQRVIRQRIIDGILPNAPIFGDIRAFVSAGYAAAYQGLVDVITGGFPCQPFSNAGKQLGADDERNMWPATRDCVRIIRPRYCLFENVPGLLNSGYFGTIVNDLAESGYCVRWKVLSAAEVGAPHKRNRLWIMAYTDNKGLAQRQGIAANDGEELPPTERGCVVADTKQPVDRPQEISGEADGTDATGPASWVSGPSWWAVEPAVGRVANGMAHRVDRLKAIGNGQVPAVVAAAWHLLIDGVP